MGSSNVITGVSYNISANGLFVVSQNWPWAGASATLEIQLPSRTPLAQELQLHSEGRVVRVVQDGSNSGFAIVTTSGGWAISRNRKPAAMHAV